jgi:hypothetical protein
MAEFRLIITDMPNGESKVSFELDEKGSISSPENNTLAQNMAIFIGIKLKEAGFDGIEYPK